MPLGDDDIVAWSERFPTDVSENPAAIGELRKFWLPLLMEAYANGIFPWPHTDVPELPWFCPEERMILELDHLHMASRSSRRFQTPPFRFTVNQAVDQVLAGCAERAEGSWLTPEMCVVYRMLFALGVAVSVEAWNADGILVGGLYGIWVRGKVFTAESMFHRETDASKFICWGLVHALAHWDRSHGTRTLFDAQTESPHLIAWGAKVWSREAFLEHLISPLS